MNGGVKGGDGSAEELDRERLVRSRLQWAGHVEKDGGWQTTEESGGGAGQDESR